MSGIVSPGQFILDKFGGSFEGFIVLWEKQTKQTFSFAQDELDKLDAKVAERGSSDLYLALGTQAHRPEGQERGGAETVLMLPAFFGDIDFANSKGSSKRYPPDEEMTLKILGKFPLAPTTIIRTGNGLHVHWDLEAPLLLPIDKEREEAKALWGDFQHVLQRHFVGHGYQIDSLGDLSRLYRIPGTFNHKVTAGMPPMSVEIISRGGKIKLEEVKRLVAYAAPKTVPKPKGQKKKTKEHPADHNVIMADCAWYRETVVEGAVTCPEPDWFAGASITGRCENGEAIFHGYSAVYPTYTRRETEAKLKHALAKDSGPRTCASIRNDLGHEATCAACPHWGKITSPIQLGGPTARPYDPGDLGPIPLGYSGSDFLFRNQQTRQVVRKSASQLITMPGLLEMAPLPFWLANFSPEGKFSAPMACNSLIQACLAKGPVDRTKIRGEGVWIEGDRIVVNLGNETVESGEYIYASPSQPLQLSAAEAQTDALLAFLSVPNWQSKSSPTLLFGWAVSAVICGALPWRVHAAITGPAKAGKSTTWMAIAEALKPLAIVLDGASTEAGIRQHLGPSARPVLLDEFDIKSKTEAVNAQKISKLMRSASSAVASVARGTPEGKAFNFSVNAAFLVAGINILAGGVADSSRVVRFELKVPSDPERSRAELVRWRGQMHGMGPAFCNMAVTHAPDILASIPVLRAAMPSLDMRQVDNFATLLAGYFVGMNRRPISPDEASKLVQEHQEAIAEHAESQEEDDAQECLNTLLGHVCRVGSDGTSTNKSLGQLLAEVFSGFEQEHRIEALGQHGIRMDVGCFMVANSHPQLARIFQSTPWAGGLWKSALIRLPGAAKVRQRRFMSGPVSRAIRIPKAFAMPSDLDDPLVVTPSRVSREY